LRALNRSEAFPAVARDERSDRGERDDASASAADSLFVSPPLGDAAPTDDEEVDAVDESGDLANDPSAKRDALWGGGVRGCCASNPLAPGTMSISSTKAASATRCLGMGYIGGADALGQQ
jgi:hypothetical protein